MKKTVEILQENVALNNDYRDGVKRLKSKTYMHILRRINEKG
jgi:hypothetical protein